MLRAAGVPRVCPDPPDRPRGLGRLLGAGTAADPASPPHAYFHLNSDTTAWATRRSRPGGSAWGRSRTASARSTQGASVTAVYTTPSLSQTTASPTEAE